MSIGTAMIVIRETAKKSIKEAARQVAKDTEKETLKGKLMEAVKQEIVDEVKGKVKEEIDESVVDTKAVGEISAMLKPGTLKGKLQEAVKREARDEFRERVVEDVDDGIVDMKSVHVASRGAEVLIQEGTAETSELKEKEDDSDKAESLKDKMEHALKSPDETGFSSTLVTEATEQKTDDKEKRRADDATEGYGSCGDESGASKRILEVDDIPSEEMVRDKKTYSNLDGVSGDEKLDKYGMDGVQFEKGLPYSGEISRVTVEIESPHEIGGNAENIRSVSKADSALAEKPECSSGEVKEAIKNKIDGIAREEEVGRELEKQYPPEKGYQIVRESYLRDKDGNIVRDPVTGEARRVDFMVVKDGKVVDSIEVTSKTADKTNQSAKEDRIRSAGGNYIMGPDGNLVKIPSTVHTRIERRD